MAQPFDVLIHGGTIVDGTGGAERKGSVGIVADKIVYVGDDLQDVQAKLAIDATGLVIAPGFIDSHTHDDAGLLFEGGHMLPKLSQGVTTVIVGNCGVSLAPFDIKPYTSQAPPPMNLLGSTEYFRFTQSDQYVRELAAHPPTINFAYFVGHMTLRIAVMGEEEATKRAATEEELKEMQALLSAGLAAGALGLSTGLWYPPNMPATVDEVIALTNVVAQYGGLYSTHMRNESDQLIEAVEEALTIGKTSKVPIVISHHKCFGKKNYGKVKQTLARIDEALPNQGVSLDVYPYTASSTILRKSNVEDSVKVFITWSKSMPEANGKDLMDLAKQYDLPVDDLIDKLQPAGAVYFCMLEEDVQTVMKYKQTMIGSDGLFFDVHPHPRLWGTFPRVLGKYTREEGTLTLTDAIRKMTSLPALTYGLHQRGNIAPGYFADITLFDPNTIIDTATFELPTSPAAGIKSVFVNGKLVYDGSQFKATAQRPGQLLTRK
jgi:N-acyl-D-amino-acid deacylase